MPVTAVAILFMLAAVALEALVRPTGSRSGWGWFSGWAAAGFLSAFATLSFAIGLLVLPFALLAIFVVSRFAHWPEALGFGAGLGVAGVAVAAINVGGSHAGDYGSWLAGGLALVIVCSLTYGLLAGASGAAYPRSRRAP